MGRASRAKKLRRAGKQSNRTVQLPLNLDESHRPMVEALWQIPALVAVFDKVERLPEMQYYLSISACELFEALEVLVKGRLKLEPDENVRQAWVELPAVAVEMAISLHTLNSLSVSDTVPEEISRTSLEHGIQLAFNNMISGQQRVSPQGIPLLNRRSV